MLTCSLVGLITFRLAGVNFVLRITFSVGLFKFGLEDNNLAGLFAFIMLTCSLVGLITFHLTGLNLVLGITY